jgi:hypothetical protein
MNDDTSLYGQDEYFARIERQFGIRRDGPLMLSPRDWQRVEGWQNKGIPLEVVLRGINRAFDHFEASAATARRINSLSYCEQHIFDAWEQARELAASAGTTGPSDPSVAHLMECAVACRRHGAGDRRQSLEVAAAALEELAQRAPSLSPAELDASATGIEQALAASLGEDRQAVTLPPFSPWAL